MMPTAAERLAQLDQMPGGALCAIAQETLDALVGVLNQETVLMRAGRAREASELTAEKARLAQDYMGLARAVQRQVERLKLEAPAQLDALRAGHERLATQMAENLRVIATARAVTEDLLTDVAESIAARNRPKTYGANGTLASQPVRPAAGVSINRSL